MAGVWVFAEQQGTLLELVGEGRRLADRLGVTLTALVPQVRAMAVEAIAHGADQAIVLMLPEEQPLETAAGTIAGLIRAEAPTIFLVGATLRAKDLAARIAARLGAALATDAIALRLDADGTLEADRMIYGGAGIATERLLTQPAIATVPPHAYPAPEPDPRIGEVREITVEADARARVVARRPKETKGADIAEAKAVVGVGRGVGKAEDLSLVNALADAMGAAVGCTRPVAEDLGWLPEDRYIGISGRKIAPRVYLAVGASGQVQHVAGVRDAKVLVAINRDENAPIFKHADYGLVGDLYTVLPALTAELKQRLG